MNPFTYNPFIQPGMASAAYASGMQSIGSPAGYNPHGSGLGFDASTLAFAGMSRSGMRPTEGQQLQANHLQRLSTQMQDFLNRHDSRMSGIYSMVHQAIPVEQRAAFRRQLSGGPLGEFMGGLMNNTPLGQYLGGSMHSFGFGSLAIASQPMRQFAMGRGLVGPDLERLQFAGASRMALDLQRHFMTATGALDMRRTGGLDRDRMGNVMAMLGDAGTFRGQDIFKVESKSGQLSAALNDRAMDQIKKTLENTFKLVSSLEDLYGNVGDNQLIGLAQRITGMNMRSSQDIDRALRQVTQYRGYARGAGVDEKAFLNAVAGTTGMMGQLFGGTEQQAGMRTAAMLAGGGTNLLGRYMAQGQNVPLQDYLGKAALDQAAISRDASGRLLTAAAYYRQQGVLSDADWQRFQSTYAANSTNTGAMEQILRGSGININRTLANVSTEQLQSMITDQGLLNTTTNLQGAAIGARRAQLLIGRSGLLQGGTVEAKARQDAATRLLAGGVWSRAHLNQLFTSRGDLGFIDTLAGLTDEERQSMRGAANDFLQQYGPAERNVALANLGLVANRFFSESGAYAALTPAEKRVADMNEVAADRQLTALEGVRTDANFVTNFASAVLFNGKGNELDKEYAILARDNSFLTGPQGIKLSLPGDLDSMSPQDRYDAMVGYSGNMRRMFKAMGVSFEGKQTSADSVMQKLESMGLTFTGEQRAIIQKAFVSGGGSMGKMLMNREFAGLLSDKFGALGVSGVTSHIQLRNPGYTTYIRPGDGGIIDVATEEAAAAARKAEVLQDFVLRPEARRILEDRRRTTQTQYGSYTLGQGPDDAIFDLVGRKHSKRFAAMTNRLLTRIRTSSGEDEMAALGTFNEELQALMLSASPEEQENIRLATQKMIESRFAEGVMQRNMIEITKPALEGTRDAGPTSDWARMVSEQMLGAMMRSEIKGQMTLMDKQTNTFQISLNLSEKGT